MALEGAWLSGAVVGAGGNGGVCRDGALMHRLLVLSTPMCVSR